MKIWRCAFGGITPIGPWDTTLYLSSETANIGFAFGQLLNFTAALWGGDGAGVPGLQAATSPTVILTRYEMWELDPLTGKASSRISASDSAPGTGVDVLGPIQACAVCELRPGVGASPTMGRMHTPPLVVSQYSNGLLGLGSQIDILNAFGYAFSNINGTGVGPVLYSRKTRLSTPVSHFFVPDLPRVLARRSDKYRYRTLTGSL